jgi:hypothetical protein
METSQGNSLCSYLKQKCLFRKTEDRKINQVLSGGWPQWEGEDIRKGCKRMNMVEYYALMYENGKMRPAEAVPGMGGGRIKENDGGAEFKYDIL